MTRGKRKRRKKKHKKPKFLYATTHRGKQRATKKQHKLLEARGLPHTHVMESKYGTIYRVRVNT